MSLDADKVQARARSGVTLPGVPRREEVEPDAEAGLQHDEVVATRPAIRQPVATQEHVPGLRKATLGRVVHVPVARRPWRAALAKIKRLERQGDATAQVISHTTAVPPEVSSTWPKGTAAE